MPLPPNLATRRLRLRPPRAEDASAIFARYGGDPEVTRHLSWPTHRGVADAAAFVRLAEAGWQEGTDCPWLVEDLGGRLLGAAGVRSTALGWEVGYCFARDAWGHGYAREAVAAVVAVLAELPPHPVVALVAPTNVASVRVLEACGFVRDRLLPRHKVLPNLGQAPVDLLLYRRP
jgi:ribosomal-protein-alanine N-acetyltransferase